jgi:hypothetical protein
MTNRIDMQAAAWRTSSYSTGGNQCVEVAILPTGHVAVRDSKNREAGTHIFSRPAWKHFLHSIKNNDT